MATEEVPYHITAVNDHLKVQLLPELNESAWDELESLGDTLLTEVKNQQSPSVIIDLTRLDFINSSLVAIVIQVWKLVDEQGGKTAILNTSEMVEEVLNISGLKKVWFITASEEEAVAHLSQAVKQERIERRRTFSMPILLGIVAVLSAVACFALYISDTLTLDPKIALGATISFSLAGLLLGATALKDRRKNLRILGVVVLISSLVLGGLGLFKLI
ncbi:STAS domain-containing protein [Gimesia benthica]|uniref:STAS domain-containing protein n=1 Tax=Gimesia benthica TaxID=2608982 RepID=A0A6I6ACZ1_9PLAN|nr:STAS domain-containing protein [Gimesia benthica]QGQ24048.1 STAS domain-containing protein [Gimesia benthica]